MYLWRDGLAVIARATGIADVVNLLLRRALGSVAHIPRNSPLPLTCLGAKTRRRYHARTHPATPLLAPVRVCPQAHRSRRVRRSKADWPVRCSICHPNPKTPRGYSILAILACQTDFPCKLSAYLYCQRNECLAISVTIPFSEEKRGIVSTLAFSRESSEEPFFAAFLNAN